MTATRMTITKKIRLDLVVSPVYACRIVLNPIPSDRMNNLTLKNAKCNLTAIHLCVGSEPFSVQVPTLYKQGS